MLKSRLHHPGNARDVLYCVCQAEKPAAIRKVAQVFEKMDMPGSDRMPNNQPVTKEGAKPGKQANRGAVHVVAPVTSARSQPCVYAEVEADPPEALAEDLSERYEVAQEMGAADTCETEETPSPTEEPSRACRSEQEVNTYSPLFSPLRYAPCIDPFGEGLLYYQKYWFLSDVDISVRGEMVSGTPMGLHDNTLRLINKEYSYYIPLRQVDYIRTADGLESSFRKECLFDSDGAGCGVREGRGGAN